MKVFKWNKCKHVGRNKLLMIDLTIISAIAVCDPVGFCAVDNHRVQPSMEIVEIKPFYRRNMQPELDKGRIVSSEYICPIIIISPLDVIFYQSGVTPFPGIGYTTLHLTEGIGFFNMTVCSLCQVLRKSEKRFLVIIAKWCIESPLANIASCLGSVTGICCFSWGVTKDLSSKNRIKGKWEKRIPVVKKIQPFVTAFAFEPLRHCAVAPFFYQLLSEIQKIEIEFLLLTWIKLISFLISLLKAMCDEESWVRFYSWVNRNNPDVCKLIEEFVDPFIADGLGDFLAEEGDIQSNYADQTK